MTPLASQKEDLAREVAHVHVQGSAHAHVHEAVQEVVAIPRGLVLDHLRSLARVPLRGQDQSLQASLDPSLDLNRVLVLNRGRNHAPSLVRSRDQSHQSTMIHHENLLQDPQKELKSLTIDDRNALQTKCKTKVRQTE